MRTKTGTVFAHFRDVVRFDDDLHSAIDDPQRLFSGDDAAQHHVLDNGWYWMLRMDNGVTSVGVVLPSNDLPNETEFQSQEIRWHWWQHLLEEYPSIGDIMRTAEWVAPQPGLLFTQRMSRCRRQATGPGWVLLPTSYGFIDPLHSTGIAHGLSGVARVAEILLDPVDSQTIRMQAYGKQLRTEIEWLDTIVGGCYRGLPSFARFAAYSCYYFTAAIQFERQMATDPNRWPHGYFMSELSGLRHAAEESYRTLAQQPDLDEQVFVDQVRRLIAPWNHVGLLEPALKNRLARTSAPKYPGAGFR
jgi:FADH2 O2-dependent halogenase